MSPGEFLTPKGQVPRREVGNWVIQPAPRSRGFTGYTHFAMGRCEREDLLIMIGPPTVAATVPNRRKVRVQIGSSVCWQGACRGHDALAIAREVFRVLDGDVLSYLAPESEVKPRRVDTCIDHSGYHWQMSDLQSFAGRPKARGMIEDLHPDEDAQADQHSAIVSTTGATYYYGKRNAASRLLRIYNKTVEAAVSGKLPWMEPIWLQAGWDGIAPIWRAEIEHGSQWLVHHGFDSMLKLEGCERELWAHYLDCVRHTCGTNSRLKNRPTSPIWETITSSAMTRPPGTWQWCPRKPTITKDVTMLIKQAVGCIASAIEAFGSIPWRAMNATVDDIRAEVLKMVIDELSAT